METDVFGKTIRDKELLRQIQQAIGSQRQHDPHAELRDPIEDNPCVSQIVREVEHYAEKESMVAGSGPCRDVWVECNAGSNPNTVSSGIRRTA